MDISVLVSWKTVHRPFAWTIGTCPHCSAVNAVRVDELAQQFAVYFVPIYSSTVGYQCKCDLCQRPLADVLPEKRLGLADWNYSLGLPYLSEKLGLPPPPRPEDGDAVIDSLLRSVTENTKLDAVDISLGLTTGCILGALIGAAIGYTVLPTYLIQMDALGCVFAGILGGLLLGGIIGASVAALVRRHSLPYQLITAAMKNYSLSGDRIASLGDKYPMRVRGAALRARDAASLAMHGRA
jgi:hypothetical protein